MTSVQKINFTATTTNLLQQNPVANTREESKIQEPLPPRPRRAPRPPSTLSYISTCGTVASFIVAVIALKRGNTNAKVIAK